jgi:hypothetical protein
MILSIAVIVQFAANPLTTKMPVFANIAARHFIGVIVVAGMVVNIVVKTVNIITMNIRRTP